MKNILLTALILLLFMPLLAQIDLARPNFNPYKIESPILDRLKMSHSMGFEAGGSSFGKGYYLSRYTNHLKYQLNEKLELDVDLNFVNFGSMQMQKGLSFGDDNDSKILPDIFMRYKPSENMTLEFRMNSFHSPAWQNRFDRW